MYEFNHLDHLDIQDLESVQEQLKVHGCTIALIKSLPKNANDKNQIYFHSDASLLNSIFDLRFSDRGDSTSETKRSSEPGKSIPQAVFHQFSWLSSQGELHNTKACKAIIYAQYPEARLSGFITNNGEIPRSISIDYTKSNDLQPRYIAIGATPTGSAIAMMLVNPGPGFIKQFDELDNYYGSKVCKAIEIRHGKNDRSNKLEQILTEKVGGQTLLGCRYDKEGNTIPFTATQVHGYTLEHACGIKPNSDKEGDIFGIELKCFTRKKLTLFTPEPDGGLYSESYASFMVTYGYNKEDDRDTYRFTGLHRAYIENQKTKLTLKIYCFQTIEEIDLQGNKTKHIERKCYDPKKPITKQMNGMEVVLEDREGNTAASWSLERLLNCWGAKHNEVVYVPATKEENLDSETVSQGYKWNITFSDTVLWCKNTNAEKLFQAIHSGTIYLDPAPKYSKVDPKMNKRRSQWRINDIYKAADELYETKIIKKITN